MRSQSRGEDVVCRIGGEEFSLLLPNTSIDIAQDLAERLRHAVQDSPLPEVGSITISVGVAHWPEQQSNIDEAMRAADQMLYRAKREGRNQVQVASNKKSS